MEEQASENREGSLLEGWISRAELARELGVSVDTLARWETSRCGPPLARIGRCVFYRRAAVLEWLESREQARGGR